MSWRYLSIALLAAAVEMTILDGINNYSGRNNGHDSAGSGRGRNFFLSGNTGLNNNVAEHRNFGSTGNGYINEGDIMIVENIDVTGTGFTDSNSKGSIENSIPGTPGQDYPALHRIPSTGFSCVGEIPGYYADTNPQAGCQVFHICEPGGRLHSFLCPVGTIFNQQYFVCDWWFNFQCEFAGQFYSLNSLIGKADSSHFSGNSNSNHFRDNSAPVNTGNYGNSVGSNSNFGTNVNRNFLNNVGTIGNLAGNVRHDGNNLDNEAKNNGNFGGNAGTIRNFGSKFNSNSNSLSNGINNNDFGSNIGISGNTKGVGHSGGNNLSNAVRINNFTTKSASFNNFSGNNVGNSLNTGVFMSSNAKHRGQRGSNNGNTQTNNFSINGYLQTPSRNYQSSTE